jgi:hypothetical protein
MALVQAKLTLVQAAQVVTVAAVLEVLLAQAALVE